MPVLLHRELPAGEQIVTQSGSALLRHLLQGTGSQRLLQSGFPVLVMGGTSLDETPNAGTVLLSRWSSRQRWYDLNCDQARSSPGGLAAQDDWCGTIFWPQGLLDRPGAVIQVGTEWAGTTGPRSGIGQGNMADKALSRACRELWVRFYTKALIGYIMGAEKGLTFNDGVPGGAGIKYGNLSFNCAGSPSSGPWPVTMGIPVPVDQCFNMQVPMTAGPWWGFIARMRLNDLAGISNGEFDLWSDNCGSGLLPVNPLGAPTLRRSLTGINFNRFNINELIRVLWFEGWANAPSIGERIWLAVHANDQGSPGYFSRFDQAA
jgi:hypothetical protein